MADVVVGKKVIVSLKRGATYVPWLCFQTITLSEEQEMIPTTTVDSGQFNTYTPRLIDWRVSLQGLFYLRDIAGGKWHILEMFTDAARAGLDIQVLFTDEGAYSRYLTGKVLIPSKSLTGTAGQIAKVNVEWLGNGGYTISDTPPNTSNNYMIFSDWINAAGGETTLNISSDAVEVIEVDREDGQYKVITSGTPGQKEVFFNGTLHTLTFHADRPCGAGELIFYEYKKI